MQSVAEARPAVRPQGVRVFAAELAGFKSSRDGVYEPFVERLLAELRQFCLAAPERNHGFERRTCEVFNIAQDNHE